MKFQTFNTHKNQNICIVVITKDNDTMIFIFLCSPRRCLQVVIFFSYPCLYFVELLMRNFTCVFAVPDVKLGKK